jgi:ACT domain-containing protein
MLQQIISLLKEIITELAGIRAAIRTLAVQELLVKEELLDNSDAMRLLKISPSTLYRWRKQNLISPQIIGNKYYYVKAELVRLKKKL